MTFADDSKGCVVQNVTSIEDPAISVYVGGNLTVKANGESEGSMVVDGNVTDSSGLLAGKVLWGMGFYPPANATMLSVGGNLTTKDGMKYTYTGGNARIGGTANRLRTATKQHLTEDGYSQYVVKQYTYPNQGPVSIQQRLGKTAALKVDTDGDGKLDMDYNGYTGKTLIPLSDKLKAMPVTGTVTVGKAPDQLDHTFIVSDEGNTYGRLGVPIQMVDIVNSGLITFTGDGQPHTQVFTLDDTQLAAAYTTLKLNGAWDLAFNNIPDGQSIIINVSKADNRMGYTPGWRIWVNGQDYTTAINKTDETLSRYRSIASRILWNYPTMTNLTLSPYPESSGKTISHWENGQPVYEKITIGGSASKGTLFPGSVLLPRGSLYDYADTNGRILVGKDMTFDIWEHHNAPWTGFNEPQCFSVSGKTSASIS